MNQKIEAIKAIRDLTRSLGLDAGLKESKDFVDSLWGRKEDTARQEVKDKIREFAQTSNMESGKDLIEYIKGVFFIQDTPVEFDSNVEMRKLFRRLMNERWFSRADITELVAVILKDSNI